LAKPRHEIFEFGAIRPGEAELRYVLFGDESTLPGMQALVGSKAVLSVVASNRPQSVRVVNASTIVQPARGASGRSQFVAELRAVEADAFLCFSYSMILDYEILALPPLGAINIHGGLLPHYRGANILNWAIIEGATTTGVTAHYMSAGIDEGDIIYVCETPIDECDTAATLKVRLDELGMEILSRICDELHAGRTLPRVPQDSSKASYYRRRKPEDGRIDWALMSDRQVYDLVRALVSPWPGAFTFTPDDEKVIIEKYMTLEEIAVLREKYGRQVGA
jgi:methionyl-tRNA formyltransferase